MRYATMTKTTKLMPLRRHKRSQNPRVLVDEVVAVVEALMRIRPVKVSNGWKRAVGRPVRASHRETNITFIARPGHGHDAASRDFSSRPFSSHRMDLSSIYCIS